MDERLWKNDKDGWFMYAKSVMNVERTDVVTHLLPIPVINTFKVQHLPASSSEGTIECGDGKGASGFRLFEGSNDRGTERSQSACGVQGIAENSTHAACSRSTQDYSLSLLAKVQNMLPHCLLERVVVDFL